MTIASSSNTPLRAAGKGSPHAHKQAAASTSVHRALLPSSLGTILLSATPGGLCGLHFTDQRDCPETPGIPLQAERLKDPSAGQWQGIPLRRIKVCPQGVSERRLIADTALFTVDAAAVHFPDAQLPAAARAILEQATTELAAYARGERRTFNVPLEFIEGTAFQQAIWRAMCSIPQGQVVSYGELAQRVGKSAGHGRAVGAAVGANPVSIIVPCHRVVASNRQLNGYGGGLLRKLRLLQLEGVHLAA